MRKIIGIGMLMVIVLLGSSLSSYADGPRPSAHRGPAPSVWHHSALPGFAIPPLYVPTHPYHSVHHYYLPPVVIQAPPVYVEPAPAVPASWYYCPNPSGYYPYVQACPGGWVAVPAS